MFDYIRLQTVGESPQETQSQSTVTISLRATVISVVFFTVVLTILLLTSSYSINNDTISKTDLREFEHHVSTLQLDHWINNLQQEYVEKMHRNISHSLFLNTNALLELHNSTKNQILQVFDDDEKPFKQVDAEAVSTYRNQLSDKIDKSFVAISHEQTFRRVASEDWTLANETKEQIKKLYDEEFQAAVLNYEGRDPAEFSLELHKLVSELVISDGVTLKYVPPTPRVFSELRTILNVKYNKKLQEHAVIGIDFGERYIISFVYANGHFQLSAKCVRYVGLEEYSDGYKDDELPNAIAKSDSPLPIFYDLKEIIRAWNSFNASSDKLYWTFEVQEETDGGPSVSSSKSQVQHTVESVVAKLFRRVKEANHKDANRCVITVPFSFTEDQRNLILNASYAAGFQEVTLLDEDISAALTLQYVNGPWSVAKTVLFLEFNQLSWNIYILEGHQSNFSRIVSVEYNETQDVVNYCLKEYCQRAYCEEDTFRYDGSIQARIRWRRLYVECEKEIFYFFQHFRDTYYIRYGQQQPMHEIFLFNGNKIKEAIRKQVGQFTQFIDAVFVEQVKLTKENIDEVIMGGKYGNLRMVREVISEYFSGRDLTVNDVSPDNTVAYGAAVKGLELAAEAIRRSRLNGTVV